MNQDFKTLNPKVILGVGAHPDDIDVTSSGTMAKYAAQGAKIYYLVITDGAMGTSNKDLSSKDLQATRQKEQQQAANAIKAEPPIFLNYPDGCLEVSMDLKKDIVKVIRQTKPDIVITMDPTNYYSLERGMINHPDHRAAGQATLDAIFPLARDHLAFKDLMEQGLDVHKVKTVLLTSFEGNNYYEDISPYMNQKMDAIKAHASQFGDPDMVTSNITKWNKANGEIAGFEYAEGFKRIDLAY